MSDEHDRLSMRLSPATIYDLEQLCRRLNLGRTAAIRLALREACERRGIAPYEEADRGEAAA